jgi:primary-amine oxidase
LRHRFGSLVLGVAVLIAQTVGGGAAANPLDPLSADEISTAVSVLGQAGKTDRETRFALIDLDEPDKAAVLEWRPGQPVVRRAFVIARQHRTVYEGLVDLAQRQVERWQAIPDVQSGILSEELKRAQKITTSDAGWQEAMRKRGYDPATAKVFCAPMPAGYSGTSGDDNRRLLNVTCFDSTGTRNVWSRPIEGLHAIVDLDDNRVVRLLDSGLVPVSRDPGRFDSVADAPVKAAPAKASFAVEGNTVHWRNWSFHYRLDPRTGLVLSLLRYRDRDRDRMVLYRGSLAEMFIPYMDPDPGWSFRVFMDVGEYGVGPLSLPLTPGIDCPADATFLAAVLADDSGAPRQRKSVICLFERNTDAPLWRHAETANNTYAARPNTELVMRTIPSLGNYDYIVDWILTEAGVIRIEVGATGIDQVKGVRTQTMADPSAAADTSHGTLVAPNLVGINHDHFLSFRLDVDIDGERNWLMRQRLVPERLPDSSTRRSLWRVVEETINEEGPLKGDMHGDAEVWRIVNPNRTNRLGQHPGYELRLGHSAISLLAADDFPQRRAGFAAAPLWVTSYDRTQLYAAGLYPNQSRGGDGLPAYAAQHRRVANGDIVLWYTMGFHHLPRPEDWPVLPTMWHSVSLVPFGFFDRNPGLGATKDPSDPDAK